MHGWMDGRAGLQEFQGRVPGHAVQAVDTTGAGDAFVSGFLTQLVSDLNLYKVKELVGCGACWPAGWPARLEICV